MRRYDPSLPVMVQQLFWCFGCVSVVILFWVYLFVCTDERLTIKQYVTLTHHNNVIEVANYSVLFGPYSDALENNFIKIR
jgi:hypothetical protein